MIKVKSEIKPLKKVLVHRPGGDNRNNITNEVLRQNGIRVIEMNSAELSRGRGGFRCMSMPLVRED